MGGKGDLKLNMGSEPVTAWYISNLQSFISVRNKHKPDIFGKELQCLTPKPSNSPHIK